MTETAARPQLAYLTAVLDELKAKGTHFKLRVLDDQQAPVCHYDGREVINLACNNYLGLANHPKLLEAALKATRKYGVGSGAVRTISGTMSIHMELEERIAALQERGGVRGVPVRLRGQRGHGLGDPEPGRSHHFRRAEPRQHHRWLPALASEDPRLPRTRMSRTAEKIAGGTAIRCRGASW